MVGWGLGVDVLIDAVEEFAEVDVDYSSFSKGVGVEFIDDAGFRFFCWGSNFSAADDGNVVKELRILVGAILSDGERAAGFNKRWEAGKIFGAEFGKAVMLVIIAVIKIGIARSATFSLFLSKF